MTYYVCRINALLVLKGKHRVEKVILQDECITHAEFMRLIEKFGHEPVNLFEERQGKKTMAYRVNGHRMNHEIKTPVKPYSFVTVKCVK